DTLRRDVNLRNRVNGDLKALRLAYRLETREMIDRQEPASEALTELVLRDGRGTRLSHRDLGVGVSQVIPVLVHARAASDALIAIEQPEIHLHPALQAELGDVLIQSALGEQKNTFILETHSEHLILRVLRRIRECSATAARPNGVVITPEDVAVLFVQA